MRPVPAVLLLALTLLPRLAAAAETETARVQRPIADGTLSLRGGHAPARQRISFRGRWDGALTSMFNPALVESTLHVAGGAGEGDSGLIELATGRWRSLKRGRGFVYADPQGSAGGIRRIVVHTTATGGTIRIAGGRAQWHYVLDRPQSKVTVTLTIGLVSWCAEFQGAFMKNAPPRVLARSTTAPTSCPCESGAASTWAAIQKSVFARHGCTDDLCHGSALSGGLDLRADAAYASLVDVASTAAPALKRVEPGAEGRSLLYRKLARATLGTYPDLPGSPMPNGLGALSTEELQAVALWIHAGAPATGVVVGTDGLLASCLPPAEPIKIRPPDAPAVNEGVQLFAPPWTIPAHGEGEVCYATYYDFSSRIPQDQQVPCPDAWGGSGETCFYYGRSTLTMDPNSHHSIIQMYRGTYDVTDPSWGPFTCHGGAHDGETCDPTGPDTCGPDGGCAGAIVHTIACIGYGPPDFGSISLTSAGTANAPSINISTQPYLEHAYPEGVVQAMPIKGVMVWNSHAFNLTAEPATNQQWLNLYFVPPDERRYANQDLFQADDIFVAIVPPFETREYCRTFAFDKGTRLSELSSHTHKRGKLFRVWGPGVAHPCSSSSNPSCAPEDGTPVLTTTDYANPAQVKFETPVVLDSDDPLARSYKFCARYDNGAADPSEVRRRSNAPLRATVCKDAEIACLSGPKKGQKCGGSNAFCDSQPGAGDGVCDACPLRGGVTTDDEMFILLGSYYCVEGADCYRPLP